MHLGRYDRRDFYVGAGDHHDIGRQPRRYDFLKTTRTTATAPAMGCLRGPTAATRPRRALIAFDLSVIPHGATIQSVELTLYLGQVAGSGGGFRAEEQTVDD